MAPPSRGARVKHDNVPAGAVSPVFRAPHQLQESRIERRVQTRADLVRPCQAGDLPPLRPPLPLLPQVSPKGRVAAQRCASISDLKEKTP